MQTLCGVRSDEIERINDKKRGAGIFKIVNNKWEIQKLKKQNIIFEWLSMAKQWLSKVSEL